LQQHLQTTDISGVHTFPDNAPVKKIDYILVSPNALRRVEKVEAPPVHYSDHLPFMANVDLN
jgi:endonuclease/exonuclease/phosphatase family metal-dependent hydrolase